MPLFEIEKDMLNADGLMRDIIEKFAPAFAPGSSVLYLGDTGQKWGIF